MERKAGITHYQIYKLTNNMDVSTEILRAICNVLECKVEEIMEFIPENNQIDIEKQSQVGESYENWNY